MRPARPDGPVSPRARTPSSVGSMNERRIIGSGLASTAHGITLDAWFPQLYWSGDRPSTPEPDWTALLGPDPHRPVQREQVTIEIDLDAAPASTVDAYARLHALSLRLVRPNEVNLDGIFGQLPNVAWTNAGPVHPEDLTESRPVLARAGIQVTSLDKFPRLLDYVTPPGVRIADASRVRLGAYLSPGTTVMHEGFVNFNAGTLGTSMVEGRISQGVVVGDGSDIGGGASIMGTLSGGGSHRISLGARTLLGANSGIGISLGDDCVVEAGLYVTAGSKIALVGPAPQADGAPQIVKGSELSGANGILYRRNSLSGTVEAVARTGAGVTLNEALHA